VDGPAELRVPLHIPDDIPVCMPMPGDPVMPDAELAPIIPPKLVLATTALPMALPRALMLPEDGGMLSWGPDQSVIRWAAP